MITNEQVEAALRAWYDAGDAGNFASMFAALKAAELTSCARIAELEAVIDLFIAYDETDDEDMVAMVQCYDAAIEAARKVRGK
jgi:hypothetical protein